MATSQQFRGDNNGVAMTSSEIHAEAGAEVEADTVDAEAAADADADIEIDPIAIPPTPAPLQHPLLQDDFSALRFKLRMFRRRRSRQEEGDGDEYTLSRAQAIELAFNQDFEPDPARPISLLLNSQADISHFPEPPRLPRPTPPNYIIEHLTTVRLYPPDAGADFAKESGSWRFSRIRSSIIAIIAVIIVILSTTTVLFPFAGPPLWRRHFPTSPSSASPLPQPAYHSTFHTLPFDLEEIGTLWSRVPILLLFSQDYLDHLDNNTFDTQSQQIIPQPPAFPAGLAAASAIAATHARTTPLDDAKEQLTMICKVLQAALVSRDFKADRGRSRDRRRDRDSKSTSTSASTNSDGDDNLGDPAQLTADELSQLCTAIDSHLEKARARWTDVTKHATTGLHRWAAALTDMSDSMSRMGTGTGWPPATFSHRDEKDDAAERVNTTVGQKQWHIFLDPRYRLAVDHISGKLTVVTAPNVVDESSALLASILSPSAENCPHDWWPWPSGSWYPILFLHPRRCHGQARDVLPYALAKMLTSGAAHAHSPLWPISELLELYANVIANADLGENEMSALEAICRSERGGSRDDGNGMVGAADVSGAGHAHPFCVLLAEQRSHLHAPTSHSRLISSLLAQGNAHWKTRRRQYGGGGDRNNINRNDGSSSSGSGNGGDDAAIETDEAEDTLPPSSMYCIHRDISDPDILATYQPKLIQLGCHLNSLRILIPKLLALILGGEMDEWIAATAKIWEQPPDEGTEESEADKGTDTDTIHREEAHSSSRMPSTPSWWQRFLRSRNARRDSSRSDGTRHPSSSGGSHKTDHRAARMLSAMHNLSQRLDAFVDGPLAQQHSAVVLALQTELEVADRVSQLHAEVERLQRGEGWLVGPGPAGHETREGGDEGEGLEGGGSGRKDACCGAQGGHHVRLPLPEIQAAHLRPHAAVLQGLADRLDGWRRVVNDAVTMLDSSGAGESLNEDL